MKTYQNRVLRQTNAGKTRRAGPSRIAAGGALVQRLQDLANKSDTVKTLQGSFKKRLGKKSNGTGEVELADQEDGPHVTNPDTSPRLPHYAPGTNPAWDDSAKGIPKWAADEYKAEAPRTMLCSMTDGKIGSVYFDDCRIRTTHSHEPEESKGNYEVY